jgi:hypothetical protein
MPLACWENWPEEVSRWPGSPDRLPIRPGLRIELGPKVLADGPNLPR